MNRSDAVLVRVAILLVPSIYSWATPQPWWQDVIGVAVLTLWVFLS